MAEKQAIAQAGKTEVKFEWLGAESLDLSQVVDIESFGQNRALTIENADFAQERPF